MIKQGNTIDKALDLSGYTIGIQMENQYTKNWFNPVESINSYIPLDHREQGLSWIVKVTSMKYRSIFLNNGHSTNIV